ASLISMSGPLPKVAVVIAVHNGLGFTRRCLAALKAQTGREFGIIVVDDGSTDGTSAFLREAHPEVTVLSGGGNLWCSGATNAACRHAIEQGADVLILCNNDNVQCSPDLVRRLSDLASSTGDCVGAVALVERSDGTHMILQAGGTIDWHGRGVELLEAGDQYI